MLTVDASSNPYQIWTASLMRWARKAPSPSDEGQAHRLAMFRLDPRKKRKVLVATRMDIFFLHLFASVEKCLDEADGIASNGSTISMSAGRFNPHSWSETPMFFQFVVSNSCCRRRPEHHRGFGQHGQLQPKACWTMEPTIPSMDGKWKIWVKPLTT